MPKIGEAVGGGRGDKDPLAPYRALGLDLSETKNGEAFSECPFCGSSRFSANAESGKWRCWSCGTGTGKGGGNAEVFVRCLWQASARTRCDLSKLAADRRLSEDTLRAWGVCRSVITGDFIAPGWSPEGNLNQVYSYVQAPGGGRRYMKPADGMPHQLYAPLSDDDGVTAQQVIPEGAEDVFVCEGLWDACALWQVVKAGGGQWKDFAIVSAPSASVFPEKWGHLFKGKNVWLCYHNDHPKVTKDGRTTEPAGWAGMRRAAIACHPYAASIRCLTWGPEGYDPGLPDGHDVRDATCKIFRPGAWDAGKASEALDELFGRFKEIPEEWAKEAERLAAGLTPKKCESWGTLRKAWKKTMRWTDGLDCALSVVLAAVISTKSAGDQLWVRVIGPASSGKTVICEAVSVARRYVFPKDSLAGGLISGYQTEDGESLSLAELVRDKTLILNEADALLQLPNLPQLLSQLRAFYTRNLRSQYGNKMSRDHEGVNCTVVIAGTSSIRKLNASELGDRFVDVVIMEGIDESLEDAVLRQHLAQACAEVKTLANGRKDSQFLPDRAEAMQLTGGYVEYLRENAAKLIGHVHMPGWAGEQCLALAKFVSFMRARPSTLQEETAEREFPTRLLSQFSRLAMCLAAVTGRDDVDAEVMRRVKKVALDTARGRTLEIARLMAGAREGVTMNHVVLWVNDKKDKVESLVRFLRSIGAVEEFVEKKYRGVQGKMKYRLTERLRLVYDQVMAED